MPSIKLDSIRGDLGGAAHESRTVARCRAGDSRSCLRGDGGVRARRRPACRAQGNAASSHAGLDLGQPDGGGVSSFWIHQIRLVGPWSPIHLLSIFTLVMLPLGVWQAHRHRVTDHRRIMILGFLRCARHRRPVHAAAGTDHARGGVRPVASLGNRVSERHLAREPASDRFQWPVSRSRRRVRCAP